MTALTRSLSRIFTAAAIAATLFTIVAYAIALGTLAEGPSPDGYAWLDGANHGTWAIAAFAVLAVVVRNRDSGPAIAAGWLGLASGLVGGVATGLWALGLNLASFAEGSPDTVLYSLLLAVAGTGVMIAPASVVLATGSLVVPTVSRIQGLHRGASRVAVLARLEPGT